MASTNKTKKAGLNLWVPDDPVLREDFNADNETLDKILYKLLPDIEGEYTGTGGSRRIQLGVQVKRVILIRHDTDTGANSGIAIGILGFTGRPMQIYETNTFFDVTVGYWNTAAYNYRWYAWYGDNEQ